MQSLGENKLTIRCRCKCRHNFCYLCGVDWKHCPCAQWDDERLEARAEQIVARRPAPGAARRARRPARGPLAGGQGGRPGDAQHRPAHRPDRLPGRRLLRPRQRQVAADRGGDPGSVRRSRPPPRHRRDRPQHLRLHQLVRPPPLRAHRHPRRRQGRRGVVPGLDRGRRRFGRRPRPAPRPRG